MMTIAMHRASPTMMSPVRYSGRSGRKIHARANISAGPRTQLSRSELIIMGLSAVTVPSRSYRTFASGGYIMTSSPTAMGSEMPWSWTALSASSRPGTMRPRSRPTAMARRIHTAR